MPIVKFVAILPSKVKSPAMYAALESQMLNFVKEIPKKMIENTWDSWEGATPTATVSVSSSTVSIIGTVYIAGNPAGVEKWQWLDKGTPPHIIEAKNAPYLAYPGVFKAKTRPAAGGKSFYGSMPGGKSGEMVYRVSVNHPGITARSWSKNIANDVKDDYKNSMNYGMARAAQVSGHSMSRIGAKPVGGSTGGVGFGMVNKRRSRGIAGLLGRVKKAYKRGVQVLQQL